MGWGCTPGLKLIFRDGVYNAEWLGRPNTCKEQDQDKPSDQSIGGVLPCCTIPNHAHPTPEHLHARLHTPFRPEKAKTSTHDLLFRDGKHSACRRSIYLRFAYCAAWSLLKKISAAWRGSALLSQRLARGYIMPCRYRCLILELHNVACDEIFVAASALEAAGPVHET